MQKRGTIAAELSAVQLHIETAAQRAGFQPNAAGVCCDSELLHELQMRQIELEAHNETLRQSQMALEESRDRYADFYDFAPVGYLTLSDKGLVVEINLTGAEMLGLDRTRLLQASFGAFVAAEDADSWYRHFTGALQQDVKLNCEVALLRLDGTRIEVRMDSLRLTKAGKAPVLRVVLTDMTGHRQADDALKASEQRFRDIVNTTDGIVWEADATTFTFTFISQQAERLLGYPADDWLQPGFWVANLHPDDRVWAPAYCASYTERVEPHDFEYRFIARDGRTVWLHDLVTVVAVDGAPRWLRGIMVDVTLRKQAEEQLLEMAMNLESKVQERTKQLRALSGELTMAEERERRLLAQDLHDNLGQLLAIIKIKLTSIVAGSLQPSVNQVVDLVDQAERSARMITLQLSPPILQTLGLAPALEWLADEMERTYGITVHVDHDSCRKRLVDEVQAMLYRSARELLINVARHAQVSEANLTCLCDGNLLVLVVCDDGCGFNPVNFPSVSSEKRSFGLSSIYERVANIGGDMDIDSSPGNGTTISLTVPCSMVDKKICYDPNSPCR